MVNEIIEDVVTFENGGLNNSVDAMTEVSQCVCERERESVCVCVRVIVCVIVSV